MGHGLKKSERLRKMEQLYCQRGFTDQELAVHLGVTRQTIFRDRIELEAELGITIEKDAEGRYRIHRSQYLSSIRVNLPETVQLYLAARRASQQTRSAQQSAASSLEKLALSLKQPMTQRLVKAASTILERRANPLIDKVFEAAARAWVDQSLLRIRYRGLDSDEAYPDVLAIYLIEPSPWSDSVYLIGHSDRLGKIVAYRLDRIEHVFVSGETYTLPDDYDEDELLRYAWGIWRSNKDPDTVRLRFRSGRAAKRLQESVWHPLETVTTLENGDLLWAAPIAEPREMLPWVRGWGADVEVVEPDWLRGEVKREARRLGELYEVMEVAKQFIAHVRAKDRELQSLQDHLSEVSTLTGQFAEKIGLKETGLVLGMLHDLGKASDKFQKYILSGEGLINPDAEEYIDPIAHKGKIDHTTAGAQVLYQQLWTQGPKEKIAAQVLALCIASHHSGLIDCLSPDGENNFKRRMEKSDEATRRTEALANLPEIQTSIEQLLSRSVVEQLFEKIKSLQENQDSQDTSVFKAGLLIRFLLSCLIDADRLDTADFETPGNIRIRNYGQYYPWQTLVQRLNHRINEFEGKPNRNEVDLLRSQVSQACLDFAPKPKGIYQLTVPTGGAKTLGSLRFALNHAERHNMDRVFYIIPYTSIIDQNAQEIRKILEDQDDKGRYLDRVVLEHHSNLTPEEETYRQSLLAQNWDAPVVLTTQVQFLEALFGSGTRSPRRMHQLANSVIILDEVQTLPINTIHMLNVALRFLVNDCGATVVLCTATQPPLEKIDANYRALALNTDSRIIADEQELFEKLKRVEVYDERKVGGWSEDEVAKLAEQQLQEKGSVLIVVNTKKSARGLYHAITAREIQDVTAYHLSTSMCPTHRLQMLDEIKDKLNKKERVVCVSTQLIEAGVDIDFGSVIRYLAGLDSIAQAAGRCNRHGVQAGLGNVWIVNPKQENIEKLQDIVIGVEQAQRVLDDFRSNPDSFGNSRIGLEAMAAYYKFYYANRKDEMQYKTGTNSSVGRSDNLFNLLAMNTISASEHKRIYQVAPDLVFRQSFQTAAKTFCVIDSPTQGVIVQHKEGEEIVTELCSASDLNKQYKLLKRAQRYSINLFPHEFARLAGAGAIREIQPGAGVYYLDKRHYSDKFGWSEDAVTDMELLTV